MTDPLLELMQAAPHRQGGGGRMKTFIKLLTSAAVAATLLAPPAAAAPVGEGCQTDFWMYQGLRASTRMICDGYRRADGSWERRRGFFAESYYRRLTCSRYSCSGGYWVPELEVIDRYPVTDATVLHDEPPYLESVEPRLVQ